MTTSAAIAFYTIVFLGPIPFWHLLLHAFLPVWRRSPGAFYAAAAGVWALVVPLSWGLTEVSPQLFVPPAWATTLGLCVSVGAFLVFLWSLATLKPRRFFVWAVLKPEGSPPKRIVRGPYRYTAHPTYLAIVLAVASHFLATGHSALLGAAGAMGILLSVVASLEARELEARLSGPVPEPEAAPALAARD